MLDEGSASWRVPCQMIDVLGVFESAWGQTPGKWVTSHGRAVNRNDLIRLVSAHDAARRPTSPEVGPHQIWPLISHHTHRDRNLFVGVSDAGIVPRVLTLLLTHDGIVAADPLVEVVRLADIGQLDQATAALSRVVVNLAAVEPLIASNILRLTSLRPKLTDTNRKAVLTEFGTDERMTVFTNFLEAAVTVSEIPEIFVREYRPQVVDLFERFGLSAPALPDVAAAADAVRQLAAAVIEVSWQFAVCAQDPSSDLALSGSIELHLAEQLLGSELASPAPDYATRMLGKTRHLARFEVGNLPSLMTEQLAVADAIAIRRDDTFAKFRDELRAAVDQLDTDLGARQQAYVAQEKFQERMRAAAGELVS